ncbi:MAG: phage tail tape measure protein, partial [Catenulispora sp.]|nr:phage tail tape measure protein [Catenulispora sp.]
MPATADRTVVARLVLDIAGYSPNAVAASKSTSALATAQKDAAASAKAAGTAQREAAAAAKDASATASASAQAMKAAQSEAASAAKAAAAAQVEASKATTDAERAEAEAVATTAKERSLAAEEALTAARAQAEADAQAAAAAKTGAAEAAKYATVQRDVASAAKEAAVAESTSARETEAATAERTKAYKDGSAAMGMLGLATGAAVGLMVKSAGDFQSATQHFVTDAGESQQNLGMIQAGILSTATATGTATTALTDAMYHIESAGFHGASGLKLLTTAAEGAKVGGADLGVVAKTLTGTMNSYNMSGDQSVTMMNQLIATVGAGDMKMNDLAGSLGNVTPKAAAAGISFAEVGGAIATMTSQNMSADQATQDLSNTISALQKPNNVAIQQMQQMGLDSNDVSQNLGQRGLTGTLQLLTTAVANHTQNGQVFIDTLKQSQNAAADANTMLKQLPASVQNISRELLSGQISVAEYKKGISGLDAPSQHMAMQFEQLVKGSGAFNTLLSSGKPEAETFSAAMSNMLGGVTGLNTSLMLTGGRMATFQANVATVADAAKKGGTEVDNWGKIQQTFNQKVDVTKASLGALGIAIGTTLLPVIADLAKWTTDIVAPIAEWVNKNQTLTAVVLGSATALAALVLAINGVMKGFKLVTNAIDGVKAAVDYYSKSSKAARVETEALGTAQAAAAKETEALTAANTAGAVKAEAMGVASASAAKETEAAAVSTG